MTGFATPTIAVLIIVGVVIFFVLVIWSIRHHRDPELRVDSDASIDDLIPSLAGLTHSTAVEGNSVEVLEKAARSHAEVAAMPEQKPPESQRRPPASSPGGA